mmetsp:Transcript_30892/g.100168  ORF Transcript_30892/g.100168 Transcript_30892/m.100168 type:complete len:100 (+) Transcript_30892:1213-1512(+)
MRLAWRASTARCLAASSRARRTKDSTRSCTPAMMWMSKRFVQPGRNPSIAAAFGKVGDLQYHRAFLSAFEYTAPDDEDLLWSLRFFNARLMPGALWSDL